MARQRRQVLLFGAADFAGDVDRGAAQRVFARLGRPSASGRAVGGEDRRPRRQLDLGSRGARRGAGRGRRGLASQAMPPSSKGSSSSRLDLAEGDRVGGDRRPGRPVRPSASAGSSGVIGVEGAQGRHLGRFAVGGDEVVDRDRRAARPGSAPGTSRRSPFAPRPRRSARRPPSRGIRGRRATAPTRKATKAMIARGSVRVMSRRRRSTSGGRLFTAEKCSREAAV